ncbi:LamG domain-containing protein [Amycolatopsis aidingensis]|uniref:LamG domain-containing protein n=1 Tax=Amycolatopsis aidingensis TaxID=2842453 RepID=UPI001C0D0A98|nr:LamG domain-containing protein [Amycolatopsis aidingensis]
MKRNSIGSPTRRTMRPVAALVAATGLVAAALGSAAPASAQRAPSAYDTAVLADGPVAYWRMNNAVAPMEWDASGHGLTGIYSGQRSRAVLPNGDLAADFDGATGYLEVGDDDALSPATTGQFTLEAWMRPDTLEFPNTEKAGYVHWVGKGEVDRENEYVARMYSLTNGEDRPNRISGYAFNLYEPLGAGSYFQDPLSAGDWIHYTLVINVDATSTEYPYGYTKLYRDGVLRDQDQMEIRGNIITPENGTAPLRVGTRDFESWFAGAIGKVAVYDYELTAEQIAAHTDAMTDPAEQERPWPWPWPCPRH